MKIAQYSLLFLSLLLPVQLTWAGPEVRSFTPTGEVKGIRQIRVQFSEDMIALGNARANSDLFDIDCPFKGEALWADTQNWIYNFQTDLPAGLRCEWVLKKSIKTLSGHSIEGQKIFSFTTGGPAIQRSQPWEGGRIQEDQAFILSLDAPAEESTVLENAYFSVDGLSEKVPVRIIKGSDREKILKEEGRMSSDEEMEGSTSMGAEPHQNKIIIQAKQRFPYGKKVTLIWQKGIAARPISNLKSNWKKWLSLRGWISKWKGTDTARTSEEQTMEFEVRQDFSISFSCERDLKGGPCNPLSIQILQFSAPVSWKLAEKFTLKTSTGQLIRPTIPKKKPEESTEQIQFSSPFSENATFQIDLPSGIVDENSRTVSNAKEFPLTIKTGSYSPLAKFSGSFGIIESQPKPVLPLTLRNLEPEVKARLQTLSGRSPEEVISIQTLRLTQENIQSIFWALTHAGQQDDYERRHQSIIPKAKGFQKSSEVLSVKKPLGQRAFEVVGVPLPSRGFYVLELESKLLGTSLIGADKSMYVSTAALVTDLAVHFKTSTESSLVWVTSLQSGKPVGGAAVTVYSCDGNLKAESKTDESGIARLDGLSEKSPECQNRSYKYDSGYLAVASKEGDFSFTHTSWNEGIEPWRFNVSTAYSTPVKLIGHAVLDRSLLRAGEVVHMTHLLRKQAGLGFRKPEKNEHPSLLTIEHLGSGQKYKSNLQWDASSTAESTFTIPKDAKLGTYSINYSSASNEDSFFDAGTFQVEEFRVPLMKAEIQTSKEKLIRTTEFQFNAQIRFLSGGGASQLPVHILSTQSPASVGFEGLSDFRISNGVFKIQNNRESSNRKLKPKRLDAVLDSNGSLQTRLTGLTLTEEPSSVNFTLNYQDPNGEFQSASESVSIWPSKKLVGVKFEAPNSSIEQFSYSLIVTDLSGKRIKNAPVESMIYEHENFSVRKKILGGLYAYENREALKELTKGCSGVTNEEGLLVCKMKAPTSGNIVVQAKTTDEDGRVSHAYESGWVYENEEWWFEQDSKDRIDILADKNRYEPGQTAIFQVRSPFKEATVLVTVEREGIIESKVTSISSKKPLIEIPIKPEFAPNVFVSVFVVRGRNQDVQPTALVDLGRPAYKMGIASIKVGWNAFELKVKVSPQQETYRVREKAKVDFVVTRANGEKILPDTEMTIAVVDQGLLDLQPNRSWELLERMMETRPLEIKTATGQAWVVGKRHFGLKALPSGGGGGLSSNRTLFDTLVFYKGRVPVSVDGKASVEFQLNDSLTSFKVVAIAHDETSLFGTGSASLRTSQDLSIFSGTAPLGRVGDHIPVQYTIRNSSAETHEIALQLKATGVSIAQPSKTISIAAGQSQDVLWWIDVPAVKELSFDLSAQSTKKSDVRDTIHTVQKVIESVPVRTQMSQLVSVDQKISIPVEAPKNALANQGAIQIQLSRSLLPVTGGVQDYMRQYPYRCLEQKISRAISLGDIQLFEQTVIEIPLYLDSDGLARFFPSQSQDSAGSVALTAYLLSVTSEASKTIGSSYALPAEISNRMENALEKFIAGTLKPRRTFAQFADLTLNKLTALDALSRYRKLDFEISKSLQFQANLLPTSSLLEWTGFLERSKPSGDHAEKLKQAQQMLQSRLNFQGTQMSFGTETKDSLWWLMASVDQNAARMLIQNISSHSDATKTEAPKLARGLIDRLKSGHWDTTLANTWGSLALRLFSKQFENDPVTGTSSVNLGSSPPLTSTWTSGKDPEVTRAAWPLKKEDLVLSHAGTGKPWAIIKANAAIPRLTPVMNGYQVTRTVVPIEKKKKDRWSKGDTYRVKVEIESQTDRSWVVLDDPIPSGASILSVHARTGSAWSAFEEKSFEALRVYYEWAPQGTWSIEYDVRLNQTGKMNLPPTRVEAMYSPEMFSEFPNSAFQVDE